MTRDDLIRCLREGIKDQNDASMWTQNMDGTDEILRVDGDLSLADLADFILQNHFPEDGQ